MKFRYFLSIIIVLLTVTAASAQKLPNVQQGSITAPADIKIDGKADEWGGKLKTYNSATEIFYTICNDDQNIYFAAQATDHTVINKILGGGITLMIKKEKGEKGGVSISYPVLDFHNRVWVNILAKPEIIAGSQSSKMQADSFRDANNTRFIQKAKLIQVRGLKGVDSLISVYNRDGIKVAASFDDRMVYTYELSVSLKQLGLVANGTDKIAYNIKLPGVDIAAVYAAAGQKTMPVGNGWVIPTGRLPGVSDDYIRNNQPSLPYKIHPPEFTGPTDFWGEYTLAKK